MREVKTLAVGAYDDPDRPREFLISLMTSNNTASYQITTELLPLTIYEPSQHFTAGSAHVGALKRHGADCGGGLGFKKV